MTEILLHYRGGIIYPLKVESANTTTALRKKGFNLVIAPGLDGIAKGSLYLDDGVSILQEAVSEIDFEFQGGVFTMTGSFGYAAGMGIEIVTVLGAGEGVEGVDESGKVVMRVDVPLTGSASLKLW